MEDAGFYKKILDSMRDMVLVKGPKSRLLWANKSFRDYYGMTEEELQGLVDGAQSNPDDTLQYVRDDKHVFDTLRDLNVPSEPVTRFDGEVTYFHTVKSPIFHDDEVHQTVGVSRRIEDPDIETQDLTELDAKVFTAPLRSIIDVYPIATSLLDHDLRIIKCNAKWNRLFGDGPDISNTDFVAHYRDLTDLAVSAKGSLKSKTDTEVVLQTEANSAKRYFNFKISPWRYPNETIGGVMIVATDVTPTKKNEERLRRTQKEQKILNRRLVLALEASEVGVWEWDLKSNELIWDLQMYRLYGIEDNDFDGAYSAWQSGLHPEDRKRAEDEIEQAVNGGGKFDTEFRVVTPSKEIRSIRALADLITDENEAPLKMIGVNWDITEVKRYESELRKANRDLSIVNEELTQFSYRTSHDLKAPLSTSKTLAEFTLKDIENGDLGEATENTNKIYRQMVRLESLVTDILSLAEADFGERKSQPIDFDEILQSIREKLSWMDENNELSLVKNISPTDAFLGDRIRLSQVLENLLSNSIKYRDRQKENQYVEVSVFAESSDIKIVVRDNGMGIPESSQADVFKMFKRFHPKIASGSGLGLSIVKKNIDRMNGTISMSSSGDGTCFTMSVPNNPEP